MTLPLLADLSRLAIDTGQPLAGLLRRQAMEGLLRRVAATPEGEHLVLRGSLMTQFWARPAYRPARDIDYVTTYPFDPERATKTIRAACSLTGLNDGLAYRADSVRGGTTWAHTLFPGTRFHVTASTCEQTFNIQIDVGYADPLVPPPCRVELPALRPGPGITVLACRPELGCAWKVHGLFESGRWRAKDLHDIDLIVRHQSLDRALLTDAVRVAFASRLTPLTAAFRLFRGEFGTSRGSRSKWRAFRRERADPSIPADHRQVVRSVAAFLRPIFDHLAGGTASELESERD